MRNTPQRMRPTSRQKHARRTNNTRQMPQTHYTNAERGYHASIVTFDEMPPKRFDMPPEDAEPSEGKAFLKVLAVVLAGFAVMYAVTWIYGHFRWGW